MRALLAVAIVISGRSEAWADRGAAKPSQVTAGTVVEEGPGGTWEVATSVVGQSLSDRAGRRLDLWGGVLGVRRWWDSTWLGVALPVVGGVSMPEGWDYGLRTRGVGPGMLDMGLRNQAGGVALTVPLPGAGERVAELQSSLGGTLFTSSEHTIAMLVAERLANVAGESLHARFEAGVRGRSGDRAAVAFTGAIGKRYDGRDGLDRSAVTLGTRLHVGIRFACTWSLRAGILAEWASGGPTSSWGQRFSLSIGLARELQLGW